MEWILTMFSAIVFVYLLQKLLGLAKKKKKNPPGPVELSIMGHLHLLGKNPHQDLHRLAQKHGPIMGFRRFIPTILRRNHNLQNGRRRQQRQQHLPQNQNVNPPTQGVQPSNVHVPPPNGVVPPPVLPPTFR
ncbi:hypothetical protein MIMGU_mgv11b015955mg [Erythranthe guttata]|uniref:Cytochrome P450 n=1 Tax=Erythranthe guttata TaxID=4155 RepID=A0A022QK76_ERYGU|nr:hypothetical protein MIMGU_mgv11b015955mg [Erythranthe guttata]